MRWLGVGFGRGNARQPSRATETARPAPGQQPNCGCYWHFAMSVLGYLLFIGRVYQHDAHMYEKADEDCTNNVMHTTSTQQNARSAFVCAQKTYHDMHLLMQTIIKRA